LGSAAQCAAQLLEIDTVDLTECTSWGLRAKHSRQRERREARLSDINELRRYTRQLEGRLDREISESGGSRSWALWIHEHLLDRGLAPGRLDIEPA